MARSKSSQRQRISVIQRQSFSASLAGRVKRRAAKRAREIRWFDLIHPEDPFVWEKVCRLVNCCVP